MCIRDRSSEISTEGDIRKGMIEDDLIDCMVALPSQLFYNTQIPACLWFLTRNKEETKKFRNRSNETLFIDARELGTMISRRQKELIQEDISKIADTYHNWKNKEPETPYKDKPGFCKSATLQDIRKNNYVLTPGLYIDFEEAEDDGIPYDEKMKALTNSLAEQIQKLSLIHI